MCKVKGLGFMRDRWCAMLGGDGQHMQWHGASGLGASGQEWAWQLSVMEIMSGCSLTWVVWLVTALCCPPNWCLYCTQPLTVHCDLGALIGGCYMSLRHGNGYWRPCGWVGWAADVGDGFGMKGVWWWTRGKRNMTCEAAWNIQIPWCRNLL